MRIIECKVNQEYIEGSGVVIGAAGSHNDVALRLTFDDMWLGLNIYATFTDATGEQSGVILLTPSMLVSGEVMTYDVPIPAVAKKIAGKSILTLSGYSVVNGAEKDRATNTVTAYFRVLKSDYKLLDGSKITPTIEEQIFSEINKLGERAEETETDIADIRADMADIEDKLGNINVKETDPTVPDWAKQPNKPSYTADEVGAADYNWVSVIDEIVGMHEEEIKENEAKFSLEISALIAKLNAVANSDDVDLDQLAEIVAYIKSNKTLIEAITTSKVSVSDIVDNLLTDVSNKPLSARMGLELKRMIDKIQVPDSNIPEWALQPEKPSYSKGEVGLGNVDNVRQYSESNPPPYPVTSVNGQAGDVRLGAEDVGAMPVGTKIPAKTSDITNDSGFITKVVSDLANYYTKSQTFTRDEINAKISAIPKFAIEVVSSLPTSNISATTVYLVGGGSGNDLYTEYIYANGKWEILGAQTVDLTGYATETWVNTQLGAYLKQSELEAAINTALATAKASGEFDGADGDRGTGILNTTTGIASYTTTVNGIKPTYRIALTTLKAQSKVSDVIVGDTVRYSYFLYPIIYVDADYAYMGTRVSIQGGKGDAGKDYVLTEADKEEIAEQASLLIKTPTITQEAGQSESLVMSQKAVTDLVAEAIGSGGGTSTEYETVDSVEKMTDTTKQYVLKETGTIWAYGEFNETVNVNEQIFDPSRVQKWHMSGSSNLVTNSGYNLYLMPTDVSQIPEGTDIYVEIEGLYVRNTTSPYIEKIGYSPLENPDIGTGVLLYCAYADSTNMGDSFVNTSKGCKLHLGYFKEEKITNWDDIKTLMIEVATAQTHDASQIKAYLQYSYSGTVEKWYDTNIAPSASGGGGGNYVELLVKVNQNTTDINEVSKRVTALETGSDSITIPTFWQSAVDACIAKIKALQVGRNCVTFPFFSDNHQRNGNPQYAGMLIAHIMKECNIPYCFFGGDSISNGLIADEATMIAQDKAFDTMMSYVPNGRFCRAVGNHDGYWFDGTNKYYYNRDQVYDLFLREESIAQNKHFGGEGTYYYIDDIASKVRWIVMDTNNAPVDDAQIAWVQNTALSFAESGWAVVFISHQPISNHYHSGITNAADVVSAVVSAANTNNVPIIGWFSGHVHRDIISTKRLTGGNGSNAGTEAGDLGFTQVIITSDHTGIAYDDATKHTIANDDQSHAIDFVTINKSTRKVNITRLGIGEDRSYSY